MEFLSRIDDDAKVNAVAWRFGEQLLFDQ